MQDDLQVHVTDIRRSPIMSLEQLAKVDDVAGKTFDFVIIGAYSPALGLPVPCVACWDTDVTLAYRRWCTYRTGSPVRMEMTS